MRPAIFHSSKLPHEPVSTQRMLLTLVFGAFVAGGLVSLALDDEPVAYALPEPDALPAAIALPEPVELPEPAAAPESGAPVEGQGQEADRRELDRAFAHVFAELSAQR